MDEAMIDREFLQECLREVRDGETVTIQTQERPERIFAALRELGATEAEIDAIEVTRG
jgi:hypothetical protein